MFKMFSQTKQCFRSCVLNFVVFVILTKDPSRATGDQVNTISGSEPQMFFYQDRGYPRDCKEIQNQCSTRNSTGAHLIRPDGYHEPFWVFCSEEWTVIQRRLDGNIGFNRSWTDYRNGFGFVSVNHWLGNERLAHVTNQKVYELRIELETGSGARGYISYGGFRINDEFSDYRLVSLGQRNGPDPVPVCPPNTVYGDCSRCIATCADPSGTVDCSNDCTDFPQTCVCPANYLMDGPDCVPQEQCGCHVAGHGVLADGQSYVMSNCSRCTCNSDVLTCDLSPCAQEATCREEGGAWGCSCNEGYEGDGWNCTEDTLQDCSLATASGDFTTTSGWILNCNMSIDGGGWTVIQRHYYLSSGVRQDFNQNWASYRDGFGSPSGEFWIGNDKLFALTNQNDYELRIDMVNRDHNSYYAKYELFRITDENDKYRLSELGSFSGTAGVPDSLRYHHNMYFSTPDRDNDAHSSYHCAASYRGGWWYKSCYYFIPNYGNHDDWNDVGYWYNLPGDDYLIYTEMKIRPRSASQ